MEFDDSSEDDFLNDAQPAAFVGGQASKHSYAVSPPTLWDSSDEEIDALGERDNTLGGLVETSSRQTAKPRFVRNYIVGAKIGEGAYAIVREGLNTSTLRIVAVKVVDIRRLRRIRGGLEKLTLEISVQKALKQHPNVIELLDVHEDEDQAKTYLFMEMVNGTSLQDLVDESSRKRLPSAQVAFYLYQVLTGMHYIHGRSVVHRDIKPANLLVSGSGVVKVADFGVAEFLSKYESEDNVTRTSGTPAFQAPEIANGDEQYSGMKVDVWALGVSAYVMLTGRTPFEADNLVSLFKVIAAGIYEPPTDLGRDNETICDFLSHALEVDWRKRWAVEELLRHPWIVSGRDATAPQTDDQTLQWVDVPSKTFSILDMANHLVDNPTTGFPAMSSMSQPTGSDRGLGGATSFTSGRRVTSRLTSGLFKPPTLPSPDLFSPPPGQGDDAFGTYPWKAAPQPQQSAPPHGGPTEVEAPAQASSPITDPSTISATTPSTTSATTPSPRDDEQTVFGTVPGPRPNAVSERHAHGSVIPQSGSNPSADDPVFGREETLTVRSSDQQSASPRDPEAKVTDGHGTVSAALGNAPASSADLPIAVPETAEASHGAQSLAYSHQSMRQVDDATTQRLNDHEALDRAPDAVAGQQRQLQPPLSLKENQAGSSRSTGTPVAPDGATAPTVRRRERTTTSIPETESDASHSVGTDDYCTAANSLAAESGNETVGSNPEPRVAEGKISNQTLKPQPEPPNSTSSGSVGSGRSRKERVLSNLRKSSDACIVM